MNESVNVSNYGIFNDAIGDVNNLNTGIGNAETAIATCQKQLANESIFMGPIADNCKEELEKVAKEQIIFFFVSFSKKKENKLFYLVVFM